VIVVAVGYFSNYSHYFVVVVQMVELLEFPLFVEVEMVGGDLFSKSILVQM
jgi:hypothetical protein